MGFGFVLILLAGMAVMTQRGLSDVAGEAERVAGAGQLATEVARSGSAFAEARSSLRDYMLTGEDRHHAAINTHVEAAMAALRAAQADASPAKRERIGALIASLTEWRQAANRLHGLWQNYLRGVEQELFPLATTLTAEMRRLVSGFPNDTIIARAAIDFLDGRSVANRFMFRGEVSTVAPAQTALASASEALDDAMEQAADEPTTRQRLEAAKRQLDDYARIHREVAARRAEADTARDEQVNRLGAAAAAQTGALMEDLAAEARAGRLAAAQGAASTANTNWFLAGGAILFGLIIAYLLGRAITRPLAQVTGAVQRIAAGETTEPVAGQTRRDEVGSIARALDQLRITARGAFAQQQMMEQLPIGVMTADPRDGLRIASANAESEAVMKRVEHLLPVRADAMRGQPISIFGAAMAGIAEEAKLPSRTRILLGQEVLDVKVSAIRDARGEYVTACSAGRWPPARRAWLTASRPRWGAW